MSAALQIPTLMTADEFLAWEPGDELRWHLVDGVPVSMAPTRRTHGAVQNQIGHLIANHLERHRPECSVITAPGVQPRVLAKYNVRVPDLGVSCVPYIEEESLLTSACLLIEVLSPSNKAQTWSNIWTYVSIASVQEILVLHTASMRAEVLLRRPDDSWPDAPDIVTDGELVLASIGFRVRLHDVYRTTRLAPPPR